MDILQFFAGYVTLFGLLLLLVFLGHISPATAACMDTARRMAFKILMAVVPDVFIKAVNKAIYVLFYTRNPLLQMTSFFLILLGNGVYILKVLPILYAFQGDQHHILPPTVLLVLSLAAFYLSCATDPGRVGPGSHNDTSAFVYQPDGLMFSQDSFCRTCKTPKPARSKHCNLCGICVHRFDHHCLWTNNCVGGANHRYFLCFLVCLQLMVGHGAWQGLEALHLVVRHSGMLAVYGGGSSLYDVIAEGRLSTLQVYVILESLLLQHPGCAMLVTSLMLLFVLIGLLILYQGMLVANNQTTNERYKLAAIAEALDLEEERKDRDRAKSQSREHKSICEATQNEIFVVRDTHVRSKVYAASHLSETKREGSGINGQQIKGRNLEKEMKTGRTRVCTLDQLETFYNRGLLVNLHEVFFPSWQLRREKIRPVKKRVPHS